MARKEPKEPAPPRQPAPQSQTQAPRPPAPEPWRFNDWAMI